MELSRTDPTKRKDILLRAFAKTLEDNPDTLLIMSLDHTAKEHAEPLLALIDELGIENNIALVGYIWERLPIIYSIIDVYCSPSIMEGFGMAAQEAAATKVPVVSSNLVPFVTEFLLGDTVEDVAYDGMLEGPLQVGDGAIVVEADDVNGFATALDILINDPELREEMGRKAYHHTIPHFTWKSMVTKLLEDINEKPPEKSLLA